MHIKMRRRIAELIKTRLHRRKKLGMPVLLRHGDHEKDGILRGIGGEIRPDEVWPDGVLLGRIEIRDEIITKNPLFPFGKHRRDGLVGRCFLLYARIKAIEEPLHIVIEEGDVLLHLFMRPVPPPDAQEAHDCFRVEPVFYDARRIAADDCIGRDVLRHNRPRPDDGTAPDTHSTEEQRVRADPHVTADDQLIAINHRGAGIDIRKFRCIIAREHMLREHRQASIVVVARNGKFQAMRKRRIAPDEDVAVHARGVKRSAHEIRHCTERNQRCFRVGGKDFALVGREIH